MSINPPGPSYEAIAFRVQVLESEVANIRSQLLQYVPARENELQLKNIQQSLDRIEHEVTTIKQQLIERSLITRLEQDLADLRQQLTEFGKKQVENAKAAVEQDAAQRARQDALQILAMRAVLGIFLSITVAVLIALITHRF